MNRSIYIVHSHVHVHKRSWWSHIDLVSSNLYYFIYYLQNIFFALDFLKIEKYFNKCWHWGLKTKQPFKSSLYSKASESKSTIILESMNKTYHVFLFLLSIDYFTQYNIMISMSMYVDLHYKISFFLWVNSILLCINTIISFYMH